MKELTFEEFCEIPMMRNMNISFDWGSLQIYRNKKLGIQKDVVTKRKRKGDIYSGWKDAQVSFFLDSDKREFKTVDQLYVAYMEKVCGVTQ